MRLIAASILIGFSILALALGHLSISEGRRVGYTIAMDAPVEIFVILVILSAVSLIAWELWRIRGRGYVKKEAQKILDSNTIKDEGKFFKVVNYLARIKDDFEAAELLSDLKNLRETEKSHSKKGSKS